MEDKIQQNINDLNNYNYLLLRQNRDMAEFEDMRKKLVSNITHELKTPLAIISSQVELLQYEYDETKKDYYFTSILEETDKMSRLISSILQNSKMENKIQQASLRWTSLSALTSDKSCNAARTHVIRGVLSPSGTRLAPTEAARRPVAC